MGVPVRLVQVRPSVRFAEHSKRQAWLLSECRNFVKTNRPDVYRRIYIAAERHAPDSRAQKWNLINITLRNVMHIHFTDEWLTLIRRCDEIFGCRSRPNSELAQIAWAIATSIKVKKHT